jgi:hypothetical protein
VKATEHKPIAAPRPSRRFLALALAYAAIASSLLAASASAHTTRPLLFSFASGTNPSASAVDQSTGDVYVPENPTGVEPVIAKYDTNGNPVSFSALATNTLPFGGGREDIAVAVDPVSHDIYVTVSGGVERFQASGQPAPYTAGPDAGTNILTGAGTPNGSFNGLLSLAVDASGDLYVAANEQGNFAAEKFLPSGEYSGLQFPGGFPHSVAVNSSGDVYVNEGTIQEFGPLAEPLSTLNVGGALGIAIDPQTGSIFVSHHLGFGSLSVSQFSPSGSLELEFGGHILIGGEVSISLNSAIVPDEGDGRVYVTDEGRAVDVFAPAVNVPTTTVGPISSLGLGTATLNGTVNTDGTTPGDALTGCHFDYVTQASFETDLKAGHNGFSDLSSGGSAPCTPGFASIPDDGNTHAVSTVLTGLQPNTTYHYRLQASNEHGTDTEFQQLSFETAGPPTIDQAYATEVSSSSARLSGEVNPHQLDTTYRFQYVDLATYEADVQANGPGHGFDHATAIPAAGADLGSGVSDALASAHLSGLASDTTYHYRIVAANQAIPTGLDGPDLTLTTQLSGGLLGLPDGRAWEQVTPVEKHGANIEALGPGAIIPAAASGDAITYVTGVPLEPYPRGYNEASQNIARRGLAGWSSHGIDPPKAGPSGGGGSEFGFREYAFFSTDLSVAAFEPVGHPFLPLSALAPDEVFPADTEKSVYLRHDSTCEATPSTCYTPLVTGAPGYADVPPGLKFGGAFSNSTDGVKGASPDLRHIVIASGVALSMIPGDKGGLYEYSAEAPPTEALKPLGVLPPGGAPVAAGLAGGRGAVSAEGSRVFFVVESGVLYVRVNATEEQSQVSGSAVDGSQCTEHARACTIQLDASQGGTGGGAGGASFKFATPDGSKVFFTDAGRLTADSTAQPGKPDLYEYDLARPVGQRLADLTVNIAEPAFVHDVIGFSADGSYVYFAADGVLTGGEENAHHERALPGNCENNSSPPGAICSNLYVHHAGANRFIARLGYLPGGQFEAVTARVSANGRFLAFTSVRSLTGYDNRDAVSGQPDQEVFLYDAEAPGGGGRLVCASCNPTGARPLGTVNENQDENERFTSKLVSPSVEPPVGVWFAAGILNGNSRNLSDSGRLFFNSSDALVPQDTNGTQDVYEYEPEGAGSCTASDQDFHVVLAGCVSLISSGTSGEESAFLEASENGNDVFFLTASQLVPGDIDTAYDIYDAHVCSMESPCPPVAPPGPPECAGDACHGLVEAPNDPTPGSLSFQGAGNLNTPVSSGSKSKTVAKRKHKTVKKHSKKRRKTRRRAINRKARGAK